MMRWSPVALLPLCACANLSGLSGGSGDAATDAGPNAVLFGGLTLTSSSEGTGSEALADTWLFNGKTWTERREATAPSPRNGAGATTLGGQVILFGGDSAMDTNDLWSFGQSWTQLSSGASKAPSPRSGMGVATLGTSIVLFGGQDESENDLNDTWLFNGSTWSQAHPSASPPARQLMVMAPFKTTVVMFGGLDSSNQTDFQDTWVWSGADWTEQHPAHSPSARSFACIASIDGPSPRVLLFAGYDDVGVHTLGDTWAWDGTDWTELHPSNAPPARSGAMMAPFLGGAALFGGLPASGLANLSDTWLWSGTAWDEVTGPGPSARNGAAFATL